MTTIYNIDYLNSLTMEKLYNIAKKYSFFNCSEIDRTLDLSKGRAYAVLTNNSSSSMYVQQIKKYLVNFILKAQAYENIEVSDLYEKASKYCFLPYTKIAEALDCDSVTVSKMINGNSNSYKILELKQYLDTIIQKKNRKPNVSKDEYLSHVLNGTPIDDLKLKDLLKETREYQQLSVSKIANDLDMSETSVYDYLNGKRKSEGAYKIKDYLENIICLHQRLAKVAQTEIEVEQEEQILAQEQKEQETMTEETFTEDKEMKTYDNFLNFIDTQKELPIVKKALEETLKENQNLDKILAKEEFITIETAQELNEKLFANEYTEEEILDFENQYFGTTDNASLNDKIKSFVEKHNLSLETALKLLQISEEDYKKMLEGADKVSNKTADKIYKAISAFDEFYHSEKTQDTINNTKNTFVTGFAIASAKSQTFLNKGLNKFADFLNKSADKIKSSNSENKED